MDMLATVFGLRGPSRNLRSASLHLAYLDGDVLLMLFLLFLVFVLILFCSLNRR